MFVAIVTEGKFKDYTHEHVWLYYMSLSFLIHPSIHSFTDSSPNHSWRIPYISYTVFGISYTENAKLEII